MAKRKQSEPEIEPSASMGRPSSYSPEFVPQVAKLCALGATDEDIADFFEVSVRTIYRWQNEHEDFCQSLKTGKASADDRVERSLYHKAVGYKHEAVKIFMPAGAAKPVYAPYVEHVSPDTTAAIFWLKNRRADQWRDVHKFEHGKPGEFDELSDSELKERVEAVASRFGTGSEDGGGDSEAPDKANLH